MKRNTTIKWVRMVVSTALLISVFFVAFIGGFSVFLYGNYVGGFFALIYVVIDLTVSWKTWF